MNFHSYCYSHDSVQTYANFMLNLYFPYVSGAGKTSCLYLQILRKSFHVFYASIMAYFAVAVY